MDVKAFAAAIERRFGHQQDERRVEELKKLLQSRMKAAGAKDYAAYERVLQRDGEWLALAPLLTVPETYFWRMPEHFEALAQDVLPKVLAANAGSKTLRMLSAGCASGEEAYTLRMLLDERFPQLADWKVEIVGVDLSEAALERARVGVYSEWSLRATSEARRRVNFTKVGKLWKLGAKPRAGVTFRRENLLDAWPLGEAGYDVVFCRNVLIYFSEEAIRGAIAGLVRRMAVGGYLFLGPAESLRGATGEFALCRSRDVFYYRRQGTGAANAVAEEGNWYESIGKAAGRIGKMGGVKVAALPAKEPVVDPLVLASALTEAGRYGEAEKACRQVLEVDAMNAGAHFLLGLCLEQGGELEAAEAEMTRATYLDTGFSMAHVHRGLIARRRGDDGAAVKSFKFALGAVKDEEEGRLKLFGGGFDRDGLRQICERELRRLEGKA